MRRVILPQQQRSDVRALHSNHKKRAYSTPKPYTLKRGLVVAALVFLFILTSIAWSHDQLTTGTKATAMADGQNLVSVYYDGQNKTVATGATTVGEALQKMGVTLQKGDVVEPALDQPLNVGVTNVNVYRAFSYVIDDDGKKINTTSGYRSPRKVIEQAGIKLYPEDIVATERVDDFVDRESVGQQLIITRATPVTVVLAGQTFEFRTHTKSVRELFAEKQLTVQPQDVLQTSLDAPLQAGMRIVVNRLTQQIATEEADIAQSTVQQVDYNQATDYRSVTDPGAPGKKVTKYLVTIQDGVEQSRVLLEEQVTLQPRPTVVVVGPTLINSAGWAKLRFCESGGNYANKNNPLYRGAYQFDYSTWNNFGGYRDPADAPPSVQDAKALQVYNARGASPWPVCGKYLQ